MRSVAAYGSGPGLAGWLSFLRRSHWCGKCPEDGGCTAVALPIAILVPGALTLGAWLGRRRIDWVASSFLSALLGVLWSAFASLILFVAHVLITADSTFVCLLAICVLLAIAGQLRISAENLRIEAES